MPDRPIIAVGQVWRRPSGQRVLVVSPPFVELLPVDAHGHAAALYTYEKSVEVVAGWELVAEGVRDPREAK